MRNVFSLVLALLLAWPTPLLAQTFKPIADPEKFAADAVQAITNGTLNEAARTITDTIGQPAALTNVQNSLQIFSDKKFDFSKKVIDNEIGGALRQIIYYSYVEKLGFAYFKFNFKMTSKGWALAHFAFKGENQELLPKDF